MKALIVSLHDVHPGSLEAIGEQVAFLGELGVCEMSLLVVPCFHHRMMIESSDRTLRFLDDCRIRGHELVLHGFYHDRSDRQAGAWFWTRVYTANEAEFLDLPDSEARERLVQGRKIWERRGWPCEGFIAPAWLYPARQQALLRELGFLHTNRLGGILRLSDGRFTPAQSLCYSTRSWWRPVVSKWWNSWLFKSLRKKQGVIRLSVHPHDLQFPAIKKQIQTFIELALAEGWKPLSYRSYATM